MAKPISEATTPCVGSRALSSACRISAPPSSPTIVPICVTRPLSSVSRSTHQPSSATSNTSSGARLRMP